LLDYNAVIKDLVNRIDTPEHDGNTRRMIQREILQLGPSVIPALLPFLDSNNLWIVSSIAEILGELGEKIVVPRLIQLLSSRELLVLRKTVLALAKIGDPSGIDPIIQLNTHESWHVKYCAADALDLYFNHPEIHQDLYHHFLDAVLVRGIKEDFILSKIADPTIKIREILLKSLEKSLSDTDWYLLQYFSNIAIICCDQLLNSEFVHDLMAQKLLLQLYQILLDQRKVTISNNFAILI